MRLINPRYCFFKFLCESFNDLSEIYIQSARSEIAKDMGDTTLARADKVQGTNG